MSLLNYMIDLGSLFYNINILIENIFFLKY